MQHYSPPITRQKARVLYIAQSVASTNGTRRQHQQFSQSGSSSSVGARQAEPTNPAGGSTARDPRSERAERAARRARGGEELNSVGQKPRSAANVGNIGARCRKGCTRGGVAIQHPHSSSNAGGVRTEETAAATLTGADEVAPPSQHQAASSPAPPACPLEELKPSVLNAKALRASSSMSSGPGGGGGDGMESGVTPGGVIGVVGRVSGDGAVGSSRKYAAGKDEAVHSVGGDMGEGKKGRREAQVGDGGARGAAVVFKDGIGNGEGGGALPNPPSRSGPGAAASSSARAQTRDALADRNPPAEVAPPRASPQEELEFMGGAARGNPVQVALSDQNGGVTPESSPHVVAGGDRGGRCGLSSFADEGTEARLKGKSVEAKGSTGVSPMQKRNRRELKLSEEESAMAGAPQGPVYQVTVLETEEFEASLNPEEEMKAVLAAAQGGGDWADLYSAVDSARRVCIFHRDVLAREGNLQGAVRLLVAAVGNLRSTTVRNALLGVSDMFSFLGHDMARVDIRQIVAGTMQRLAGEKRFICQTAAQAMEVVARKGPGLEVLHSILPAVDDRNAEISSKAAVYSDQCLAALGVGSNPGSGLPEALDTQRLVAGMGKALRGKLADGRSGARRALLRVRKAMGPGAFESSISEHLEKGDAASVISTLANCSSQATAGASSLAMGRGGRRASGARAAAAGGDFAGRRSQTSGFRAGRGGDRPGKGKGIGASGARSSIREQMMARKRQLEEERLAIAREEGRNDPERQGEGEGSPDGFRVSVGAGGRERDHRDGERRASAGSFLIVS